MNEHEAASVHTYGWRDLRRHIKSETRQEHKQQRLVDRNLTLKSRLNYVPPSKLPSVSYCMILQYNTTMGDQRNIFISLYLYIVTSSYIPLSCMGWCRPEKGQTVERIHQKVIVMKTKIIFTLSTGGRGRTTSFPPLIHPLLLPDYKHTSIISYVAFDETDSGATEVHTRRPPHLGDGKWQLSEKQSPDPGPEVQQPFLLVDLLGLADEGQKLGPAVAGHDTDAHRLHRARDGTRHDLGQGARQEDDPHLGQARVRVKKKEKGESLKGRQHQNMQQNTTSADSHKSDKKAMASKVYKGVG